MIRNFHFRSAPIEAATIQRKPAMAPARPASSPAVSATPTTFTEPPASFDKVMQEQSRTPEPSKPSLRSVVSLPNGGLMADPTGLTAYGGLIHYNPNYYATQDAARQLAQQLGGAVVDLAGQISNNQPQFGIALPNGTTINAGNLLAVMNNAVYQQSSAMMDEKIAELLNNNAPGTPGAGIGLYTVRNGQVSFDPSRRPAVVEYT